MVKHIQKVGEETVRELGIRDVNPEIYARFVDKKSKKRRKVAYKNMLPAAA